MASDPPQNEPPTNHIIKIAPMGQFLVPHARARMLTRIELQWEALRVGKLKRPEVDYDVMLIRCGVSPGDTELWDHHQKLDFFRTDC
jgi:hypothetical protein